MSLGLRRDKFPKESQTIPLQPIQVCPKGRNAMEMYVMRTYGKSEKQKQERQTIYPFWDYRSKRWNEPSSIRSDGTSSGSSSISSNPQETNLESPSLVWSDSCYVNAIASFPRLSINIFAEPNDVDYFDKLYQSFLNFLDPQLRAIRIIEHRRQTASYYEPFAQIHTGSLTKHQRSTPSVALLLFLHEEASVSSYGALKSRDFFLQHPWKKHHEDLLLTETTIETYPGNIQDFYQTLDGYPLCGIRHIHYGREHFRCTIFVSHCNWYKMVKFYKILSNVPSDYERDDFCLFTIELFHSYDLQLVLKRLPPKKLPKMLEGAEIRFQVSDLSSLIPFLPNICRPLPNNKWTTFDYDGNRIVLDVTPNPIQCESTKPAVRSYSRTGSLNRAQHKGFYV